MEQSSLPVPLVKYRYQVLWLSPHPPPLPPLNFLVQDLHCQRRGDFVNCISWQQSRFSMLWAVTQRGRGGGGVVEQSSLPVPLVKYRYQVLWLSLPLPPLNFLVQDLHCQRRGDFVNCIIWQQPRFSMLWAVTQRGRGGGGVEQSSLPVPLVKYRYQVLWLSPHPPPLPPLNFLVQDLHCQRRGDFVNCISWQQSRFSMLWAVAQRGWSRANFLSP